ncbi:MAG TPA: hypothetical protein VN408_19930 [Actinoplanes sp.]|nr:hypothetical protein [Actinoplanes sp.]
MDIAQTSIIVAAVVVVVLTVVAGVVVIHRGRSAVATELKGVRDELGEVTRRLAALEKLLSQIG